MFTKFIALVKNPLTTKVNHHLKDVRFTKDSADRIFATRTTKQLLGSLLVFKLCSFPWLASITPKILSIAKSVKLEKIPLSILKYSVFNQFCGGQNTEEAIKCALEQQKSGINVILDYAIEPTECSKVNNERLFENVLSSIIKVIDAACSSKTRFVAIKISAIFPMELLIRMNEFSLLEPTNTDFPQLDRDKRYFNLAWDRLLTICDHAVKNGAAVAIDAEQSYVQAAINAVALKLMVKYNKVDATSEPIVFNTYQMYLRNSLEKLQNDLEISRKNNFHFGAKIVRGAYLVSERSLAAQKNHQSPVFELIEETHKQFDDSASFILEYIRGNISSDLRKFSIIFATHNETSVEKIAANYKKLYFELKNADIYFAQLYGMADNISINLAHSGYSVLKYLPFGPVQEVIPYIIRRAQENRSAFQMASSDANLIWKELVSRLKF